MNHPFVIAGALLVGAGLGSFLTMALYKGKSFVQHVDEALAVVEDDLP